jgi:hypothetical protein
MTYRILLILVFISTSLSAQIQHWTKDEIIDKQFELARKTQKIKTAYNYATNDDWAVDDSTWYNEIVYYNTNGQKTVHIKYKTDWNNKRHYYQTLDSIFYTNKGVFSEFKRYTPVNDGKSYQCTYRALSTINKKGLIERIDYYGGYMATELNNYELRTYDKKNRLLTAITYTKEDKEDYKWTFEYDKKNRIAKVVAKSAWGGGNSYAITYTSKGLLASYTELYEGTEQSKATYFYDVNNRLEKREYTTNSGHKENTEYWFNSKTPIPYRSHLTYPRGYGTTDVAHEFLAYTFNYFE